MFASSSNVVAIVFAIAHIFLVVSAAPLRFIPERRQESQATNGTNMSTNCNMEVLQMTMSLVGAGNTMSAVAQSVNSMPVQEVQSGISGAMNAFTLVVGSMTTNQTVDPVIGMDMVMNLTMSMAALDSIVAPDANTSRSISDVQFMLIDAAQSATGLIQDCIQA
ncbi:hypothetical protein OF83DRAFT_1143418 [Amylostereum chailletii]|nr:hypothetical protein OF83DRAFT_1143418 [Amylostereum chailletii]